MAISSGLTPQTPQGAAMFRSSDYYSTHEVALLALEEGAVSALACPVIHEYYYE
jgi:hypothetical protein